MSKSRSLLVYWLGGEVTQRAQRWHGSFRPFIMTWGLMTLIFRFCLRILTPFGCIVFPVPESMDNLFGRLCESGYSSEASVIVKGLATYSYWTLSGGSKHLLALIGKLHIGSWFSLNVHFRAVQGGRLLAIASRMFSSFLGLLL